MSCSASLQFGEAGEWDIFTIYVSFLNHLSAFISFPHPRCKKHISALLFGSRSFPLKPHSDRQRLLPFFFHLSLSGVRMRTRRDGKRKKANAVCYLLYVCSKIVTTRKVLPLEVEHQRYRRHRAFGKNRPWFGFDIVLALLAVVELAVAYRGCGKWK